VALQCVATDTPACQLAFLEARHRAHAHVEERVKGIKQTGMGRFPHGSSRSTPSGCNSR
jgi:hypothetical protein